MSEDFYAKLDQRIVYSSMWEEDGDTCKVWVTLLALKNINTGIVDKNITGIARLCKLPIEKVEAAFEKFQAPDPNSSSKELEGRRIVPVERGWRVVNHQAYMEMGWSDEKKAYERDRKAKYRAGLPSKTNTKDPTKPESSARFTKPTREELNLAAAKIGLPDSEVDKFVNHYESNGWKVGGKTPMRSWAHALANWKIRMEEQRGSTSRPKPPPESNQIQEKIHVPSLVVVNGKLVRETSTPTNQ